MSSIPTSSSSFTDSGKIIREDSSSSSTPHGSSKNAKTVVSQPSTPHPQGSSTAFATGSAASLAYAGSLLPESYDPYLLFPPPSEARASPSLALLPRAIPTLDPAIPLALMEHPQSLPSHIRDCLVLFSGDWTSLQVPDAARGVGGADLLQLPKKGAELSPLSFELELPLPSEDTRESVPFDERFLHPQLSPAVLSLVAQERRRLRQELPALFPPEPGMFPVTDSRRSDLPQSETHFPLRVRVDVDALQFELSEWNFDLFFCSLALYELPASHKEPRMRLTESFHFDLNSREAIGTLVHRPHPSDAVNLSRSAVFDLHQPPSASVWMILRIERLLLGEADEGTALYTKAGPLKPKDVSKFSQLVAAAAPRLGNFTQPFAIAAVQLFPDGTLGSLPHNVTITELIRAKGDLSDPFLFEKFQMFKKEKALIRGKMVMRLSSLQPDEKPPCCVTPALLRLKPFDLNSTTSSSSSSTSSSTTSSTSSSTTSSITRVIHPFCRPTINLQPHTDFLHLLYVYPEVANLNKYSGKLSARNLALEIRVLTNDNETLDTNPQLGEPLLFGHASHPRLVRALSTTVQYHQQRPYFHSEFKVALPVIPTPKLHLLFIFKHVQCRPPGKKDRDKPVDSVVAYAFLPITSSEDGFLKSQEYDLPIAYQLAPGYLSPQGADGLRYLEKRRSLFTVRTQLATTIYSEDDAIALFFKSYDLKADSDVELRKAIEGLLTASPSDLTRFFPMIISQLLQLISTSSDIIARACFSVIAPVLRIVDDHTPKSLDRARSKLLDAFISFSFSPPPVTPSKPPFHLAFCETWLHYLTYSLPTAANLETLTNLPYITYTWFFAEILFKSIVGDHTAASAASSTSLISLSREFTLILGQLFDKLRAITGPLIMVKDPLGKELNSAISLFLKDLLSLCDPVLIFTLISQYLDKMDGSNIGSASTEAKFDSLAIILSHQHYIRLNLPLPNANYRDYLDSFSRLPKSSNSEADPLLQGFGLRHPLSSIFVFQVFKTLEATKSAASNPARLRALELFRSTIMRHACTPELLQPVAGAPPDQVPAVDQVAHVAMMYAPFVFLLLQSELPLEQRIITRAVETWDPTQKDLVCFILLWIVQKSPLGFWQAWWRSETESRKLGFFTILGNILEHFEYDSSQDKSSSTVFSGHSDSTRDQVMKMATSKDALLGALEGRTFQRLDSFSTMSRSRSVKRRATLNSMSANSLNIGGGLSLLSESGKHAVSSDVHLPAHLVQSQHRAVEVSKTFLDLLYCYVNDFEAEMKLNNDPLFGRIVITSLLLSLKKNNPVPVITAIFSLLQTILLKFAEPIFLHPNTPYCGDLVYELLKHCNYRSAQTRSEATALLCLCFLINFQLRKNVARMKLACSVGIAKLVLQGVETETNYLRGSMKVIADSIPKYVKGAEQAVIVQEVQTLFYKRLIHALHHHQLLVQHQHDSELVHDLIHQISLGFLDSPDIRFTWIDGLASKLVALGHLEEAAQCKIHLAALIAKYLPLVKPQEAIQLPEDCLHRAAPNTMTAVYPVDTLGAEDGVCSTSNFSAAGLFAQLNEAAEYLNQAQLYETAIEVQRMLARIHKQQRGYKELAQVYGELASFCDRITESNKTNARLFSNFYLVAFHGKEFQGLDGRQFIYKESGAIRLGDMMTRLPSQWAQKLGEGRVKYIPFSAKFDRAALDPAIGHIQIASVEPYLEDVASRVTPFELKNNVRSFIIENPLVRPGGNRDSPEDNGKVKTFFEVENPFPFVVKRIPVAKSWQVELSPIESAIELLEDRILKLRLEVEATAPNSKTLQIVLQGSVATTVNAGPLAIIKSFLGNESAHPPDKIAKLKRTVVDLLSMCTRALETNNSIIEPQQKPFHAMLVDGFATLRKEAMVFLPSESSPASSS